MRSLSFLSLFVVGAILFSSGCEGKHSITIISAPRLVADFEATPTNGTAPLTVAFTDLSTGNINTWEWDFDNNGTVDSNEQNPQWTYDKAGWYSVKLTVTGPLGSDTESKEMYIQVANNLWYVDGTVGGSGDGTSWETAFMTIAEGITAAGDYDLVLVADGTYNEIDLTFNGKKIYLKGVDHHTAGEHPVIDCRQAGRGFYFGSDETRDSAIDNFTIRGGEVNDAYGGAVFCESSSPTITNCIFCDNKVTDVDGEWGNDLGGAICCWSNSSPTIRDCIFIGNSARYGGAVYCSWSNPIITNCTFLDNSAGWDGGAILCYSHSNPTITNCAFNGNSARDDSGAICCWGNCSPTIVNCSFTENSAIDEGGAIECDSSYPTIINCAFSGNSAGYGGAIFCERSSTPILNNCVLWGNSATSGNEICIWDLGSFCTLNYCCVDNTGYGGETGNIDDSNNCIFTDPLFVDAAGGNLRLQSGSPCIDAGDNGYINGVDKDLDGNPRIVDGDDPPDGVATVDIGAYEYQP